MARWHPIASMVTMAPSIASMSSSFGIATISFDFSATLTWPSTSRREGGNHMDGGFPALFLIRAAHRLAVGRDHPGRSAGQRRHPGDEAVLKLLRIERGEDVAELIMRRSANGRNRRRSASFFVPKRAISTK